MTNDDDRIGYLAGEGDEHLDPLDLDDLDDLRALLADPAVWEEPSPGLEDAVVAAVTDAAGRADAPVRAIRKPIQARGRLAVIMGGAVAVAAAVIIAVVLVAVGGGDDQPTFESALSGAGSGTVIVTKHPGGWRVELDAPSLPRLDGGRFYQAWLKDAAGTLVPVGSFNEGNDVVLWAGVSPADFPQLTITVEEADGNQASSGNRVLVGDLHQTK